MTKEEAIKTIMTHIEHWHRLLRDKICDETEGKETIEAFLMAIEALNQTQWIPCDKELPKPAEHSTVLVTDCEGKVRVIRAVYVITMRKVFTAWQPLPKPYEGGTE